MKGENSRLIIKYDQGGFKGYPYGTVPFKRVRKEDLIRAKAVLDLRRPRSINSSLALTPEMHYAAVTTPVDDTSRKIYGAKTIITLYNLTVQNPQLSEALLWLGTGVTGPYNSIEYGWTVNPQLYGDSQTRSYSLWTADGLQNTGCYNVNCLGYVQISPTRLMGAVNRPVTSPGGQDQYGLNFKLFKDPNTSNWWLLENLRDKVDEPVGYWPKELFPAMKDSATVVQIGGKVYSPSNLPTAPMGSGVFVPDDFTRTTYASNIEFLDSNNQYYEPKDVPMQVTADNSETYKADYLGDASEKHPGRGYTQLFGGPDIK